MGYGNLRSLRSPHWPDRGGEGGENRVEEASAESMVCECVIVSQMCYHEWVSVCSSMCVHRCVSVRRCESVRM